MKVLEAIKIGSNLLKSNRIDSHILDAELLLSKSLNKSREEIENCSKNPEKKLRLLKKIEEVEIKERKKPKYTPLSKRQDRPDAILWLCKNASELTDGQISKLVGSTKGTVSLIRKRSYWNFSNLKPRDPVILALCSQEAFQKSLEKAKRRVEREKKAKIREEKKAQAASL